MKHLNRHIICAIDTETTGLEPFYNDLIQIAILPADMDLKPDKDILPFHCLIKPRRPENITWETLKPSMQGLIRKAMIEGFDADVAADLLNEWFEKLPIPENKRILPLGHNWAFDQAYVRDWLGQHNYEYMFDGRYRDTQVVSQFLNDVADAQVENYPFPKCGLQYLVTCLKLDFDPTKGHDAFYDALKTLEVYRTMVHHNLIDLRTPLQ